MSAVLVSGGWESTFCLLKSLQSGGKTRAYFFDYGQPYLLQELQAVNRLERKLQIDLQVISVPRISQINGIFIDRNRTLILEVSKRGEAVISLGIRGLFPGRLFDPWGDTNWFFAQHLAKELGIIIQTPALLRPKFIIKRFVLANGLETTDIFSSEGWKYKPDDSCHEPISKEVL